MKNSKFFVMLVLLFGITFMGFQCSSTELTSARLYIQQKNFDKALEVLQDDVANNPKSDEGYYLMGYVYGEKGEMGKMVESFDQSMSISNKFEKEINTNNDDELRPEYDFPKLKGGGIRGKYAERYQQGTNLALW